MRRFSPRFASVLLSRRAFAVRVAVALAVVVLLAAGLTAPQWFNKSTKAEAAALSVSDFTRPDRASAFVLAQSTGHRVEVTGERTETSTVWANADGTVTVDSAMSPIRVLKADGSWTPVDVALHQNADGSWSPASVVNQFSISNGGGTDGMWQPLVTTAGAVADRVGWLWQGTLPAPTITGATATFSAVAPGVDLVVSATPVGFEQSFVLTARPNGPVALPLAISSGPGLTLTEGADGAYALVDQTGAIVADAGVASVWDASQAPSPADQLQAGAAPASAQTAAADVVGPGQTTANVSLDQSAFDAAATGPSTTVNTDLPTTTPELAAVLSSAPAEDHTLVIAPDAGLLGDPSTQFPVTVDPGINLYPTYDSYVNSASPTSHYETSTALYVGTDGTPKTFRSYMTFDFTSLYAAVPDAAQVISAKLNLHEISASTCTATAWELRQSSTPAPQVTWNTQPSYAGSAAATTTSAAGFTECPAAWSAMDITTWVKGLVAAKTAPRPALVLKAPNELLFNTMHKFDSTEASTCHSVGATIVCDIDVRPYISITYDNYPNTPTSVQLQPDQDPSAPVLSAVVTDPDGGPVGAAFALFQGGVQVYPTPGLTLNGAFVPSGGASTFAVPRGTLPGPITSYQIRAWGTDGTLASSSYGTSDAFAASLVVTAGGYVDTSLSSSDANALTDVWSPSLMAADGYGPSVSGPDPAPETLDQIAADTSNATDVYGVTAENQPSGPADPPRLQALDPTDAPPYDYDVNAPAPEPQTPLPAQADSMAGTDVAAQLPADNTAAWDQSASILDSQAVSDGTIDLSLPSARTDYLAQCRNSPHMKIAQKFGLNRFLLCRHIMFQFYECKGKDGKCYALIGSQQFRVVAAYVALRSQRQVWAIYGIDNVSGSMPDTVTYTLTSQCKSGCIDRTPPSVYLNPTSIGGGVSWVTHWENPPGSGNGVQDVSTMYERLQADMSDTNAPTATLYMPWDKFRCDASFVFAKPGCVVSTVKPVWNIALYGPYSTVARHIYDAQTNPKQTAPDINGKSIPGGASDGAKNRRPLTRYYQGSSSKNSQVVQRVCEDPRYFQPQPYTQGPGGTLQECDEYPFASTHEQPLGSKGNFSARPVNSTQNSGAGGKLNGFYSTDRIIEGDQFWVRAADLR